MFTITIMKNIVYLWRKQLLLFALVLLTSLVHGNVEVVTSTDELKAAMNNQEVDSISIESSTPFVVANGYLINRKLFIDGNNKAILTFQPAVVGDVLFYDNETASGELTLSQITISDSKGQLLSFGATGGQSLTIFDCVFNNNSTDADSYLISYSGGEGLVKLQIDSTSFTDNTTESVLYVQNSRANITIQDSEFSFNKLFGGSAIQCQDAQELLVSRVTFEGNTTGGIGGAINLFYVGSCTISNSTFTANQALDGAAIYVGESSYPTLEHLTILNNKVTGTGLVYPVHCLGSTVVAFSIINGIGGDSQLIYSYGYNLFDAHPGMEVNTDDRIFSSEASLALAFGDHGGYGKTFSSSDNGNSIAIDVFDPTKLVDGQSVTEFDQNRNSRISSDFMDIGAVEYQWPSTITLTNTGLDEICAGEMVTFDWLLTNNPVLTNNTYDVSIQLNGELITTKKQPHNKPNGEDSYYTNETMSGDLKILVSSTELGIISNEISIKVKASPQINIPQFTMLVGDEWPTVVTDCYEGNVDIKAEVSGGEGPYTSTWWFEQEIGNTQVASGLTYQGATAPPVDPWFYFTVKGANQCESTEWFVIIDPDPITLISTESDSVSCFGTNDGEIAITAEGGTGSYTYSITNSTKTFSQLGDSLFVGLPADDYAIDVTDVNGCPMFNIGQEVPEPVIEPVSIEVKVGLKENATWSTPPRVCKTDQALDLLSLTDPETISEGSFLQQEAIVDGFDFDPSKVEPGAYEVIYETNECSVQFKQTVYVDAVPNVSIIGNDSVCGNEAALVGVKDIGIGEWGTYPESFLTIDDPNSVNIIVSNLVYTSPRPEEGQVNNVIWRVSNESCVVQEFFAIRGFEEPTDVNLGADFSTCLDVFTVMSGVLEESFSPFSIVWSVEDNALVSVEAAGVDVTISDFGLGETITVKTEIKNSLDTKGLCAVKSDEVVVNFDASTTPSIAITAKSDYCVTDNVTAATLQIENEGSRAAFSWTILNEETTIGRSKTFGNLDLQGNSEKEFTVVVEMTHDDVCILGIGLTKVVSDPVVVTLHELATLIDDGIINEVVVGESKEIVPFNSSDYDSFYNFSAEIVDENYTGFGDFSQNENGSISYQSKENSIALDLIRVRVIESQCGNVAGSGYIRIQPTNTSPMVKEGGIDDQVVQGEKLAKSIGVFIIDSEDNIDWNTGEISSQPSSGAKASFDKSSKKIEVDYSLNTDFIGEDILTMTVCDLVGECLSFDINIKVVEDFYVLDVKEEVVPQGGVIKVVFDSITNAINYTVKIEGPYEIKDAEPVVDLEKNTVTIDWGDAPDFTGKDSVLYEICRGATCRSGKIVFRVQSFADYIEEEKPELEKIITYNALSPNGDDKNDTFEYEFKMTDGTTGIAESKLRVFNRWGEVVYENDAYYKTNDSERFVGLAENGEPLLNGTYFYTVYLAQFNRTFTGYLVLKGDE
jgi:gliding motility-associated-like protein